MQDHNSLGRPQLRHRPLQLDRFVNSRPDEGFNLRLTEGGQQSAAEATHESFGSGKTHIIALVAAAVEYLDSPRGDHAHQFVLLIAFVVMVSQDDNDRHSQAHQDI
jgi:hypothetical protein